MAAISIYVGTSGWMYDWNAEGTLEWYVRYSGLNAVELNMSFYRFPHPSQVRRWRTVGGTLRWSVKVHRVITHYYKLGGKSLALWERFAKIFEELDDLIDFYLFQLPPSFARTRSNIAKLKDFVRRVNLGKRFAVEFRHPSWFTDDTVKLCEDLGITIVSVDSPQITWVRSSGSIVYLRLHGRSAWYAHEYTAEELRSLANMVLEAQPTKVYAFFNNDHWMLDNARTFMRLLAELVERKNLYTRTGQ